MAPHHFLTWKMRPSGEYVLEERSYPLFMATRVQEREGGSQTTHQHSSTRPTVSSSMSSKWVSELSTHPIFKTSGVENNILSAGTIKSFRNDEGTGKENASSLRRESRLCFRGMDIIVAAGKELRIATLGAEAKSSGTPSSSQYKVSHLLFEQTRRRV